MKAKHAIAIFILGYCLDFIGSFLKIIHHNGWEGIFTIAVIFKIIGSLVLLFKIINYTDLKKFLDS